MKRVYLSKKELKSLYFEKRLSMAEIARKFNCYASTIQRTMRKYKIKSRSLSEANRKVLITKKTIEKLYYQNKLSTKQISDLYHCSHAAILYRMKLDGLKRRSRLGTRRPVIIPKIKLKKLYLTKKLSRAEIARKLNCSRCAIEKLMNKYKIKPRSLSESQMIYPKSDFNGDLSEKAYLIGFRLGDLYVAPAKLQIHVSCSSSRRNQIILIKNLFEKYTEVIIKRNRILKGRLIWEIRCLLNKSFRFLLAKKDNIPSWILKNKKLFFCFWAGYIDAEGYIFTRLYKNSKTPCSGFEVESYDKNILLQSWRKLNKSGIKCRKPKINKLKGYTCKNGLINRKDSWRLGIYTKKNLYLLLTKIEPYIKHKKRKRNLLTAKRNLIVRLDPNFRFKNKTAR